MARYERYEAAADESYALAEHYLRVMGEPPMPAVATRAAAAYRFTWIRSFDPAITVRVEHHANTVHLHAVALSITDDLEPGPIAQRVHRILAPTEWRDLVDAIDRSGFWHTPAEFDIGGFDGSTWLFEGYRTGMHHWHCPWSPPRNTNAYGLGLAFLTLTEFDLDPIY